MLTFRVKGQRASDAISGDALFSPEAMRRAWQVIRHNGATPGVDRVTQRDFQRHLDQNLESLRQELVSGTY